VPDPEAERLAIAPASLEVEGMDTLCKDEEFFLIPPASRASGESMTKDGYAKSS
jgi:hypothetical protein